MEVIKVEIDNYPNMYEKNIDKYVLVNEKEIILGIAKINEKLDINKLQIDIFDEYSGNGYGKFLFRELLKEYEINYGKKDLRFEINSENRFGCILNKFGGINVSNNNGNLVYILPMK